MPIAIEDFRSAATQVTAWRRPLLLSHARADGDALGALVAMRSLLREYGASPEAMVFETVSPRYQLLIESEELPTWNGETPPDPAKFDGVLLLDTCSRAQLEPAIGWLDRTNLPKVVVDHHVTRDAVADIYLIDDSAAAACQLVWEWADACGWSVDREAARALFVGLATDTGWFSYSNTDDRALQAAAALARLGASASELYQRLYRTGPESRLRLLGAVLQGMEFISLGKRDRLAVLTVDGSILGRAGATSAQTEGLVNEPLCIQGTVASILLVDQDDGVVRVSLRSQPPIPGTDQLDVDVAAIAQKLGGGGHRRAAGARVAGNLADVKRRVIEAFVH